MIHTYVAPAAAAIDNEDSFVIVSWPAWVEATTSGSGGSTNIVNNDGLLFFNTMKMTV